jgi:UDP-N-acetylmuramoylalanine--D-glutamate ligase
MLKLKKGRAGVLGAGKSGLAVAKLLRKKGFQVLLSDKRPRAVLPKLPGVVLEGGGHSDKLLKCAFVVKSPGLSPSLPILAELKAKGVPVYSELEIAVHFSKSKRMIAVTGTNGKSTTTALAGLMFPKAWVAGNIGLPISEISVKTKQADWLVVEASSYQLEDSSSFSPRGAAILNLTSDHVDHHGSMEAYIRAKARIFLEQGAGDFCVFNAGDPLVYKLSRDCPSRKLYFGDKRPNAHAWEEKGKLVFKLPGWKKELKLAPPKLPGRHNVENALAAGLLGFGAGLKSAAVQKAFKKFKGIEHRLEECGAHRGLRCINDSKATNVDSSMVALRALEGEGKKILLILGGLHKGSPYTPLKPLIERCVKGVLTIGAAARKVEEDLGGCVPVFPCGDLSTAVQTAFTVGSKGDILLLSPACASFDQFQNFEERGRRFKELLP